MQRLDVPASLESLQELMLSDDFAAASDRLHELKGTIDTDEQPYLDVLEIQLSLAKNEVAPGLALARLVAVMREHPLPGLQELYQEISRLSYTSGQSSMAHSHPPPPMSKN